MFTRSLLLIVPLAMAACVAEDGGAADDGMMSGGGDGGGGSDAGTKLVSIEVVDAVISPGMSNGEYWDGIGTVPDSVWTGLASALGASQPYAAVITFLGSAAVQQLGKPDPLGTATLLSTHSPDDGVAKVLATEASNFEDTLTPSWPTPAKWANVPLTSDLRVRVSLVDEDISNDDPIDVVELNQADIENALQANQVFHAMVDDQGNAQILFVGISVRQTGTE